METKFQYNIIRYLKNLADKNNDATLQTGVEYIQTALNLYVNHDNDKTYSTQSSLLQIFEKSLGESGQKVTSEQDKKFEEYKNILVSKGYFSGVTEGTPEYEERILKAREKFNERYASSNTNVPSTESLEEKRTKSEELKTKGNDLFKKGDYNGAIQSYTEAIELYSNSIYYCNRGIAYSKILKFNEAIDDYKKCIELDPKYVKAYDRLGYTYLQQNKINEAVEIFNKGLEIDPNNNDLKNHLQEAQLVLEDQMGGNVGGGNPGVNIPGLGNMNMGNIQEALNNPNLMENLGPMLNNPNALLDNLGPMLNNPQFMNMTMQLMNDPNFQNMMGNLMNNPAIANIVQGLGGGGVPPGGAGGAGGGQQNQ